MVFPDFQSFFKPLLCIAADGKEHAMKEAREIIAKRMNISDDNLDDALKRVILSGKRKRKVQNITNNIYPLYLLSFKKVDTKIGFPYQTLVRQRVAENTQNELN